MAAVIQCDVCTNVCRNEESKYIEVYRCGTYGKAAQEIHKLDICPECYKKLCKLLKLEALNAN